MALTIEKMLLLKEFKGCRLVAGAAGLGRTVECVDTMEIPNITPWIKKNELLLTTGYSIIDRMDLLTNLLDALYKNGSAGLAIKTRFIGPLPQSVINQANEYSIPIIELPDDMPFIPLIHAIGNCIADEQHSLLLFSLSASRRFQSVQHTENYFQGISEVLRSFLPLPVIITDFLLIPYSICPKDTPFDLRRDEGWTQLLRQALDKVESFALLPPELTGEVAVQKIFFKGVLMGYIFLPLTERVPLEMEDKTPLLLSHAANALALYLSDFGAWNSQRRQQDSTLYGKLLKGALSAEAGYWVAQHGWPHPPLVLLTFEAYIPRCAAIPTESPNFQIMWVIRSLLSIEQIPCTVILHEDLIRCVIPACQEASIQRALERILAKIQTDMGMQVTAVASKPFASYEMLPEVHREAGYVLEIAHKTGKNVVFSRDLSLELALVRGADTEYLRSYAQGILGGLIDYDRRNNANLLQTLQELVNHMGVHTQTAKALFLHRNTLLYRIRRIESLTGLDLSTGSGLYRAAIALQIYLLLETDTTECTSSE